MTNSSKKISQNALQALADAKINANTLSLGPLGSLPQVTYKEVNAILVDIGGKWKGGKVSAHVFDHDIAEDIATIIETGYRPNKNELAFFPTTPEIASYMVDLLNLRCNNRVLEPSAGLGVLAREVKSRSSSAMIDCVEIDPKKCEVLRQENFTVFEHDFLQWNGTTDNTRYDAIIMNPPFSVNNKSLTWCAHLKHAMTLISIAASGKIVSLVPSSFKFRNNQIIQELREIFTIERELPCGTFKSVGTDIATLVISATF